VAAERSSNDQDLVIDYRRYIGEGHRRYGSRSSLSAVPCRCRPPGPRSAHVRSASDHRQILLHDIWDMSTDLGETPRSRHRRHARRAGASLAVRWFGPSVGDRHRCPPARRRQRTVARLTPITFRRLSADSVRSLALQERPPMRRRDELASNPQPALRGRDRATPFDRREGDRPRTRPGRALSWRCGAACARPERGSQPATGCLRPPRDGRPLETPPREPLDGRRSSHATIPKHHRIASGEWLADTTGTRTRLVDHRVAAGMRRGDVADLHIPPGRGRR